MPKKLTLEECIDRFRKSHGDKYDYSSVDYERAIKKVKIRCPYHGFFLQTPDSHISGTGCPSCGEKHKPRSRWTLDKFITNSKRVHGDRYDYSKVKFSTDRSSVEIICSKHGSFWTVPRNHCRGSGCPRCAIESRYDNLVGRRFGKIVITNFAYTANGNTWWYGACDCGSEERPYGHTSLVWEKRKSCGNCGYKESVVRENNQNPSTRALQREILTLRNLRGTAGKPRKLSSTYLDL